MQEHPFRPAVAAGHTADFSLSFSRDNGSVVVGVIGELDCSTSTILEQRLDDLLEDQGNLSIVLDLDAMTFVDSSGLSVFVTAFRHLRERGGELVLRRPAAPVRKVFEITGLHQVLPIEEL